MGCKFTQTRDIALGNSRGQTVHMTRVVQKAEIKIAAVQLFRQLVSDRLHITVLSQQQRQYC